MTDTEIESCLDALSERYGAVGGSGGLSLVMWRGVWTITSAGATPKFYARADNAEDAFDAAYSEMSALEKARKDLARTLGIEAA